MTDFAGKSQDPILAPGRNCWRVAEANRAAVLVDGAAYFAALEGALSRARRSVLIVGWDFDGRIGLRPDQPDAPALGPYLRSLVERHPDLEIRILVWSVAVIHAPGSPMQLLLGAEWQHHPRIHVKLDTEHPVYAAHHQKIVAIDDVLAFVGGTDLTVGRWDTPRHDPEDPCRRDPDGRAYPPVHDLQMAVDGEAARAVADVARQRWRVATGEELVPPDHEAADAWPPELAAEFRNIPIAVARTSPPWKGQRGVRESAALTVDALRAARTCIYLEAQYLTADEIGAVLAEALARPDGPEVVVVVTRRSHGLAERVVMGRNRDRLLRRLKRADRYDRLRVFYPVVPASTGECEVLVHAKLVLVDTCFLRIGSSNLNNRSIGLDTECDLAIEARDEATARAISALRDRLVAEHLCAEAEQVRACLADGNSLVATIDRLNVSSRCLRPLKIDHRPGPVTPVWVTSLFDPERPFRLLSPLMRGLSPLLRGRRRRRA
ncbi:phospholipase D-like domain-containing protein [Enterovirga sp.]|uniref:phospholipase D-like domain-containing protein n=1 Tax=Enterovirga sp. TaxID=2026350 RepID=UPI0026144636|nr:phospholipase D-like domain-containing protein [Enterovirga sp.]MDB5592919.1 phospholipase [Enterovirga sp.]